MRAKIMKGMGPMRISTAAAVVLAVGIPSLAYADGMPASSTAPAAPFSWNGFYAGIHGGFGWSEPTLKSVTNGRGVEEPGCTTVIFGTTERTCPEADRQGLFGGVQIGYNWMISGPFLLGVETDISASDLRGTSVAVGTGGSNRSDQEVEHFGSLRGRLGYAYGNMLLYATGGLAYVDANANRIITDARDGFTPLIGQGAHVSGWETGWVVGGGVEWRLTSVYSLKVEYQHAEFDSIGRDFAYPNSALTAAQELAAFRHVVSDVSLDTVRIGLNVRLARDDYSPLK
jgi:outer membrane immunogenic protein